MKYISQIIIVVFILAFTRISHGNKVRAACEKEVKLCEFRLTLNERRMSTLMTETSKFTLFEEAVKFEPNGTVLLRDRRQCNLYTQISEEAVSDIPTGDGTYKLANLFNETLPGPPIVVYKGQQVVVHVENKMVAEGTTVHWHGIHMNDTPWMDGVAGVSQCPINPGETFTYRFIADTAGTFWYHSHYGTQRTMGAYGPLIVLEASEADSKIRRGQDQLPMFEDEFYLVVSDWYEKNSQEVYELVSMEGVSYFYGWDIPPESCFNSTKQSDGVDCGVIPFMAGVINGRGRKFDQQTRKLKPGPPLETFSVTKGKKYRFRMICASMTFAFRVSIDGHVLNVIASDGEDIKTQQVESIIISSGERYDFWIEANNPQELESYSIRAETLELYQNNKPIEPGYVEAILSYNSSSMFTGVATQSRRMECKQNSRCTILNCPYRQYADYRNLTCINLMELRNSNDKIKLIKPVDGEKEEHFQEHFLNFHFTGIEEAWKTTINGILNEHHSAPPQIYPKSHAQQDTPCNKDNCVDELCRCTHQIDLPLGSVVQLVLFITIQNPPGIMNGNPHNIHIHGNTFQVVKVGYPTYDNITGFQLDRNQDIKCFGKFCNNATWANESWNNGNVPEMIESAPPLKDTVFVPVGGYVVVRFKADNPGYWYMHCHTEFHNEEGMSLLLKVGDVTEMNAAPTQMAQCGNFHMESEEFLSHLQRLSFPVPIQSSTEINDSCVDKVKYYQIASTMLGFLTALLIGAVVLLLCMYTRVTRGGYQFIPSS